jgi:predicted phosphodiesterase
MTPETTTVKVLTVADLHQSKTLYEQLEKAVRWHKPDLVAVVGDCLDLCDAGGRELSRAECAQWLVGLACKELVFVRGNHEAEGWVAFVTAWRASGRMVESDMTRPALRPKGIDIDLRVIPGGNYPN